MWIDVIFHCPGGVFMRIRIDPADTAFSLAIRTRDKWTCQRCGSIKEGSQQNSHYFGRGAENTRFDPENCDCLCHGCHQIWGSQDKEGYRNFKIKQIGQDRFDALMLRASMYKKKERGMELIKAREYLKLMED